MSNEIRFRLRQDNTADWVSRNPIMAIGEQGLNLDTGQIKTGDGVTHWLDLPYLGDVSSGSGTPVKITSSQTAPPDPSVSDIWLVLP